MMLRSVLTSVLIAWVLPIIAEAGELHVDVRRYPIVTGKELPTAQVVGAATAVSALSAGKWKYSMDKNLFGVLTVIPGKDDVANYSAVPLPMRIPVTVTRPIGVHLVSMKKESVSAIVALELYGTDVQGKSDSFLWQFYQRAQLQALDRLSEIQAGRDMNHSDVRVFFKILEVTRDLGRQKYLGINTELENLKNYLSGVIDHPARKVLIQTALGPNAPHLRTLIAEIDDLEADQYIAAWGQVTAHAVRGAAQQKEACDWYQLMDRTLSEMDDARARRILAKNNLGTLLHTAVNDCAAKAAFAEIRTTGQVSTDTKEAVLKRLSETEKIVDGSKAAPYQQILRRQQIELANIVR